MEYIPISISLSFHGLQKDPHKSKEALFKKNLGQIDEAAADSSVIDTANVCWA